ncbi:MAG: hypothetical protein M3N50_03560 [Pseudomonadota bacterium]|nr:hypothetical protein [Pseudomonadota bacterium]
MTARVRRSLFGMFFVVLASACAPSSQVLVGVVRAPISPTEVKIYSHPPAVFEEVAILNASSKSVFAPGGQAAIDKVVARLKERAAKLGANGIILEDFSDRETGSLGTGVGSSSYSRNSSVGLGVGGSLGIFSKTGRGRAIYVPPAAPLAPP